jgi:hypothetical protein
MGERKGGAVSCAGFNLLLIECHAWGARFYALVHKIVGNIPGMHQGFRRTQFGVKATNPGSPAKGNWFR